MRVRKQGDWAQLISIAVMLILGVMILSGEGAINSQTGQQVDSTGSVTLSPMTASAVTPSTVQKCEGTTPYLYIEDRIMDKGKTIEIPVMMCNADNLGNMDLVLNYNSSILKIKDIIKGSLNAKAIFDWNEVSPGNLKIAFASKEGANGSGSIAVMKFDVTGSAGSMSRLSGTVPTAANTDGTKITLNINPGTFTVGNSTIIGDCDGDGKLTENDAQIALLIAVGKNAEDLCYDYNKDGKVDSSDAREMLKAIVSGGGIKTFGSIVAEETFSPDTETIISVGNFTVTIPEGAFNYSGKINISKPNYKPPDNVQAVVPIVAYYVNIEGTGQLSKSAVVEYIFDPKSVPANMIPEDYFTAAYYDETNKVWVEIPIEVQDTKLILRTDHFSLFSFFGLSTDYVLSSAPHFKIYFNPSTNAAGLGAREIYGYVAIVRSLLEDAYTAYETAGFKMPKSNISVYVIPKAESTYQPFTGNVIISTISYDDVATKQEIGHEIFHLVQNQYLYTKSMDWRRWFVEATADYAADKIAFKTNQMGKDIKNNYLSKSITVVDGNHEYSTAHLLDYIITEYGVSFRNMWTAVVAEYVTEGVDYTLSMHLKEKYGSDLGTDYADFADYFIFDPDSPMPAIPKGKIPAEAAAKWDIMMVDDKSLIYTFDLKGGYTAKLWGVLFNESLFDQSTTKLKYNVSLDGTLPIKVGLEVCVLKGDKRVAGGCMLGFLSPTVKFVEGEVEKGDAVYVLGVNTDSSDQQVTVKVSREQPEMKIIGAGFTGVIGYEYTFSNEHKGIPADAIYSWRFGDGTPAVEGETVKHKYIYAGVYNIELRASWNSGEAKAQTTFEIAPDQPPEDKEEVTFYVFRWELTKYGSEETKHRDPCQGYTIRISRNEGQTSPVWFVNENVIATNGAYSIVLPVGRYSYDIQYDCYLPNFHGTAAGPFTVIKGGTNFIEVETERIT